MRDIHSVIKPVQAIPPAAAGTTGTGRTGAIIDRQGFDSVEYILDYGAATATNATVTPTMLECDTTGGSFTSVADGDMLPQSGAEAAAALGVAATRTAGTTMKVSKKLGYVGSKRYTQLKLIPTVSAALICGATAILGNPATAPQ